MRNKNYCLHMVGAFLFIFSTSFGVAKERVKTNTFSDVLVAKIGGELYFSSDLIDLRQKVKDFTCLYPDAILLSTKHFKNVSEYTDIQFERSVSIAKFFFYVQRSNVNVNDDVYIALSRLAKKNKCRYSNVVQIKNVFEQIVKLEIYLKARYNRESIWVAKNDSQEKSAVKTDGEEGRKKQIKMIENFLDTLDRQIEFERYELPRT